MLKIVTLADRRDLSNEKPSDFQPLLDHTLVVRWAVQSLDIASYTLDIIKWSDTIL